MYVLGVYALTLATSVSGGPSMRLYNLGPYRPQAINDAGSIVGLQDATTLVLEEGQFHALAGGTGYAECINDPGEERIREQAVDVMDDAALALGRPQASPEEP